MINKIKKFISAKLKNIPKVNGGSMKLIVTVVGIIVAAIVLYLCAWLASWYKTGQPSLSELRLFVDTLVSVPAVGAIGFYSAALVDKDENGESDIAEEKASKK